MTQTALVEPISYLKSISFHFLRWLLAAWIRPTRLGSEHAALGPGINICYVLPSRSLIDLLVADHSCEVSSLPRPHDRLGSLTEKRSFFFLGHPEGRIFKRRSHRKHSPRITRLLNYLADNHEDDVQVVPISLYWGHAPAREKSIFKLLLSENWSATNRFRKFLIILFSRHHTVVQYGKGISLRELIDNEPAQNKRLRKLSRILRVYFRRQRQAILGPDLSHRRTLLSTLLTSTSVRENIAAEAKRQNKSIAEIEHQARKYANEIAAHQSYRVIRFFEIFLSWLWHKLYAGIVVTNLETVKALAESNEIVYVPCHRSHIDYLLLGYVLYENGLVVPHVAAGDNLNFPIVGPLLRRAGAFFMRRSFSDDQTYRSVIDEYIHMMLRRGHSLEYFVEGARSRTGRMLRPRAGMLSMTIRSYQKQSTLPIVFVPVYIGYEKILEGTTYLGELQGNAKKKESLLGLLGIWGTLRSDFGEVTVNFGEPIFLTEFLNQHLPDWQHEPDYERFSAACSRLAIEVATRISSAAVINPMHLVATILLAAPKQALEVNQLQSLIESFISLQRNLPYPVSSRGLDASSAKIIDRAETIGSLTRTTHTFGDVISAQGKEAVLLTFYRNNIIHFFALPAVIASIAKSFLSIDRAELRNIVNRLYPFLKAEFFLPWQENQVKSLADKLLGSMACNGTLQLDETKIVAPSTNTAEFAALTTLAKIVEPTLERFFIVTSLLLGTELPMTKLILEERSHKVANQLEVLHGLSAPEFYDRSLLQTFVSTMQEQEDIGIEDDNITHSTSSLRDIIRPLLGDDVAFTIEQSIARLDLQAA